MAFKLIKKNESCNYFFKIILKKTIEHPFLSVFYGFRLISIYALATTQTKPALRNRGREMNGQAVKGIHRCS